MKIDRATERCRQGETERQRDRETERQRDRETERQRDRETERQRDNKQFNKFKLIANVLKFCPRSWLFLH